MKVHIAYDDGTLIGVYRRRKDAKRALTDTAIELDVQAWSEWKECAGGIDRRVFREGLKGWDQWIYMHEVAE